ncbi:MAG: S41 family peptidase [Chloroflexota bacterium]|nr:MAG: S41 family peptidase [Chloroflexota bacterium]
MRIRIPVPISVTLAVVLFILPISGAGCDFVSQKAIDTVTPAEINEPFFFSADTTATTDSTDNAGDELPPEFSLLNEAYKLLTQDYVDKANLDPKKLSQGAVRGMMEALDDPPSFYVDPKTNELDVSNIEGKFEGIGAVISIKDKQLTVVAPVADSPAEKAGIKAGDKILEIDGQSTSKMNLIDATLKIRGPKGTSIELLVLHEGESDPVMIRIIRDEIKVESVSLEMRDDIAYIRLTQFLKSTVDELQSALKGAMDEGAEGIVLDLRNNPGGLLNVSVDVASQFLAMGVVTNIVDSEGSEIPVQVKRGGIATHIPLILLVNEGSASASEIVAGALQDYGRAKLAGSQTYGKGSVQIVRDLSDGSALHITSYRFLTPLGKPIDSVGLTPDFVLELEDEELVDWAIQYLHDQIKTELLSLFAS